MKRVLQLVFWINLLIILGFWVSNNYRFVFNSFQSFIISIGALCGLLAAYLVLTQLMLIGRISFIESNFGHDKLARIHHKVGRFVLIFILLHFLLIIWGYSLASENSVINQFLDFVTRSVTLRNAFIALTLFIIIVVSSLAIVRLKLKYETWYFVHLIVYLAILLGFAHQLEWGGDFTNKIFVTYWWALYIIVISLFLIFRFGRVLYYFVRYDFKVVKVVQESPEVHSIYIGGKNIEKFPVKPGQFMIFRLWDKKRFWQAHPFSSSWVVKDSLIRITVKNSGDYTSEIHLVKPGTKVWVDGPLGIFTAKVLKKNKQSLPLRDKILFVAGGIGITPIRSLIEQMSTDYDCVLLYSNKTEQDIVFRQELDQFKSRNYYFLTEEQKDGFESGRIDLDKIQRFVPDVATRGGR